MKSINFVNRQKTQSDFMTHTIHTYIKSDLVAKWLLSQLVAQKIEGLMLQLPSKAWWSEELTTVIAIM